MLLFQVVAVIVVVFVVVVIVVVAVVVFVRQLDHLTAKLFISHYMLSNLALGLKLH